MSVIYKIEELCRFNGFTITELENKLGYGNGSLRKSSTQTVRSNRVQEIAELFDVSANYLLTDITYDLCPICSYVFNPLNEEEVTSHKLMHKNFIHLKNKIGFLMNKSQAATEHLRMKSFLEQKNIPDDKVIYYYNTLLMCDFAEYAFTKRYVLDIEFSDFIKTAIQQKKYFELLETRIIPIIAEKNNVTLVESEKPLIELFKNDEEFMTNITSLYKLPKEFRNDVYKEIRHARRDYADKEYFTSMYGTNTNPFV